MIQEAAARWPLFYLTQNQPTRHSRDGHPYSSFPPLLPALTRHSREGGNL